MSMISNVRTQEPLHQLHDEQIMVIKRARLFEDQCWQGLKCDNVDRYVERICTGYEFMPRTPMESDPSYKQIIPYLVFTHNNCYFLMQRQAHATEQRLKNKMSLGIGGHLQQEDICGTDFFGWAQREFHEEVRYSGNVSTTFMGLLNDDSNPVGEVHIGLVMLLHGDSPDIQVKSELKSGVLVSLEECNRYSDFLESWSAIVLKTLKV